MWSDVGAWMENYLPCRLKPAASNLVSQGVWIEWGEVDLDVVVLDADR